MCYMLFIYALYEAAKLDDESGKPIWFNVFCKRYFYNIKGIPIFMHLFVSGNFCCHNTCVQDMMYPLVDCEATLHREDVIYWKSCWYIHIQIYTYILLNTIRRQQCERNEYYLLSIFVVYVKMHVYVRQGKIHYLSHCVDTRKHHVACGYQNVPQRSIRPIIVL